MARKTRAKKSKSKRSSSITKNSSSKKDSSLDQTLIAGLIITIVIIFLGFSTFSGTSTGQAKKAVVSGGGGGGGGGDPPPDINCYSDDDCPDEVSTYCSAAGNVCTSGIQYRCKNPGTTSSICDHLGTFGGCTNPCPYGCTDAACNDPVPGQISIVWPKQGDSVNDHVRVGVVARSTGPADWIRLTPESGLVQQYDPWSSGLCHAGCNYIVDDLDLGEARTYNLNGNNYEVIPIYASDSSGEMRVKFTVDGELTDDLGVAEGDILSFGPTIIVDEILSNSQTSRTTFYLGLPQEIGGASCVQACRFYWNTDPLQGQYMDLTAEYDQGDQTMDTDTISVNVPYQATEQYGNVPFSTADYGVNNGNTICRNYGYNRCVGLPGLLRHAYYESTDGSCQIRQTIETRQIKMLHCNSLITPMQEGSCITTINSFSGEPELGDHRSVGWFVPEVLCAK